MAFLQRLLHICMREKILHVEAPQAGTHNVAVERRAVRLAERNREKYLTHGLSLALIQGRRQKKDRRRPRRLASPPVSRPGAPKKILTTAFAIVESFTGITSPIVYEFLTESLSFIISAEIF